MCGKYGIWLEGIKGYYLVTVLQKETKSDTVNVRKEKREQLPAPAADELTPFAASVSPSVRRQASSVRRGQLGAALAGWSAGWSSWRAGVPFLPGSLEYLVRGERRMSGVERINTRWRAWVINTDKGMCLVYLKEKESTQKVLSWPWLHSQGVGFCMEACRRPWSLCTAKYRKVTMLSTHWSSYCAIVLYPVCCTKKTTQAATNCSELRKC